MDDAGAQAGPVSATVPAGEALTLTAAQLEQGGGNLAGALGHGEGSGASPWPSTARSSL